jgi:hypothetical protein
MQYVGLAGFKNLGDDVVREAFLAHVRSDQVFDTPIGRKALVRHGLAQVRRGRGLPALLGGGTVLGRTVWRAHIKRTQRLFAPSRWEMLGAGVEDPDFAGTKAYTSQAEIERWKPLLALFRNVTVRGPRSQQILANHGIASTVVGDPALLLSPDVREKLASRCDVLINVTCGEDQWGGVDLDWTPALVDALRPFARAGLSIAFVSMETTDEAWNQRVARALGLVPVIHRPKSSQEFFGLAMASRLVVGTRLHSNVLACAADTPTISLEYRPKSRDFMASIGCEALCHRVDRLDPRALEGSIASTLADPNGSRERIRRGVGPLRESLKRELASVISSLFDPVPSW